MSDSVRFEALFAALRSVEAEARVRLVAGCADDAARMERFLARPLGAARREAHVANLGRETFERIAMRCARTACSNVQLRARARFKIYTSELAESETRIADAIRATHLVAAKRLLPRMFTIGRFDVAGMRIPEPPAHRSEVDDWIEELRGAVRDEIGAGLQAALDRVLAHGLDRLGIVKTRIGLALCARSS
ncbi:MAG TPA: hypothetical protein VMF11_06620 [Candidatus Baltobacteraceae bacterium]|nr:hypothetical protein [Candidatus Baltobacteraceae bacterium]